MVCFLSVIKTHILLKQKHPKSCKLNEEIILSGVKPLAHPVIFEDIDEEMIKIVAMKTKRGSDPSGSYRWMEKLLISNSFGTTSIDLRRALANIIKRFPQTNFQ